MKRRSISPSSLSSLQNPEPKFKKPFLDKDENVSFAGYSEISLPCSFGASPFGSSRAGNPTLTRTVPHLRRSVSDLCNAIAIMNGGSSAALRSEEDPVSKLAKPPQPQSLRRTVSYPNPSPAKTFSQSPAKADKDMESTKQETSNSKRLKIIEARLREMNQWWNEVMQEQEERGEEDGGLAHSNNGDTEEKSEAESKKLLEWKRWSR